MGTKHTNTFIPKVLAEARNYELTGNEDSRELSEFFWYTMVKHHTFAPGCSSDKEHFLIQNNSPNIYLVIQERRVVRIIC